MKFIKVNEINFTGKDGKTYTLYPLSLIEWGKFITWVQYKPYRDSLDAELPENLTLAILEQCKTGLVKEITEDGEEDFEINLTSTVVREQLAGMEGLCKFLQISLAINHPEVKTIHLGKIVDLEVLQKIQKDLLRINGLLPEKDEDEEESEKNL